MAFIEAPTTFYLGRRYDQENKRLTEDVVYYDSRDLTTHSVVVGMTGSGKTGLCINMLEEAILDNIPAIIIDPKGDITNLLLTFPDLKPEDFQPWVNTDDAHRAGMDVAGFAADIAQRWKDGLQSWGIVPDRLRWKNLATKYSIYTPGSEAGLPINIVASLKAPREGFAGNEEAIREKINAITSALLALTGVNADPVKDPEHVLIANIFEYNWARGIDLTLEHLILQIQNPPFESLGVVPINQFMSEKKRNSLMMEMNNIIAAPSFQSWMQGDSMDIQSLLYQPNGRPRVSVFYTAHLTETERMFITTLLLENMLGWMRTLAGTTSLRAILYIDEMFGYFPPHPRNPPTKDPMLRLLKQARAFGIGLILATQNPGDLDYKGLSNAGTWFIGRLQSENDKKKVMAGLEAMASADNEMDLGEVDRMISDISPRVFLMRNVHNTGGPILLHTRWSMSYLRGPLTRQQVGWLMQGQKQELMQQLQVQQQYAQQHHQQQRPTWQQQQAGQYVPPPPPMPGGAPANLPGMPAAPPQLPGAYGRGGGNDFATPNMGTPAQGFGAQSVPPPPPMPGQSGAIQPAFPQQIVPQQPQAIQPTSGGPAGLSSNPPALSSSTVQFFLPARLSGQEALSDWQRRSGVQIQRVENAVAAFQPILLAQAVVRYQDRKANIYTARTYAYHVPDVRQAGLIHWEDYAADPIDARAVSNQPPAAQAMYGELSAGLADDRRLKQLEREIVDMLYNTARLTVPFNPDLKIYGNPDVDFSEFQAQVYQLAREQRDSELDKLSAKYAKIMDTLEDKAKKKQRELRAEEVEIRDRKREELFTTGEALLSLWKGRTNYTLSRMSRATRYKRQTKDDIQESHEYLSEIEQEMGRLEQEFEMQLEQVNNKWGGIANNVQEYAISPLKKDIQMEMFGIGWLPSYYMVVNGQPVVIEAY